MGKKYLDIFNVPFKGLSDGWHEFEFNIGDKFFELFNTSELGFNSGNITVLLRLNKKGQMLTLEFQSKGFVNAICDRCLDNFKHPVEAENKLYAKISSSYEDATDELLVLSSDETTINVAQFIYEFISLSIPMRVVHESEKLCNKEMMRHLKNVNVDDKDETDPRWDKLKNIITNN